MNDTTNGTESPAQQQNERRTVKTDRLEMNLIDGAINIALAKAQGEMKNPVKDCVNPHFRSKYASLDSVIEATRKPLSEAGLAFTQSVDIIAEGWVICTSVLTHGLEWIKWATRMSADTSSPQKYGSSCTYARRYARMDIFGLAGDEDDDANAASETKTSTGRPQAAEPQQQQFGGFNQPQPRRQPRQGFGDNDKIAGI